MLGRNQSSLKYAIVVIEAYRWWKWLGNIDIIIMFGSTACTLDCGFLSLRIVGPNTFVRV